MKLRHLLVFTFCLIVIIPMTLFWVWPYSKALDSELQEVSQKHLVIAKNISAAFERYYQDVTGIFSIIDTQSDHQLNSPTFRKLLQSYNFITVVLIDHQGHLKQCLFHTKSNCLTEVPKHITDLAIKTEVEGKVAISTVTEDKNINSGPIMLVVKHEQDDILLAYLSTKYIIEMGERVAFGEKGHAAIVDQAGNVLAHPLPSWIQERKNIAKISAVQKMMAGQTGVEKFYSPALKGDMIAGYTHVEHANWGVMVPQPIKELEEKAYAIDQTAILVMLLGLGLAFLIAIPFSFILIKPLENLSKTIKLIEKGDPNVILKWKLSKLVPLEIRDLKTSFSNMMKNIETNKKEISKLAYFDANTNLPNRNYFYKLSNKALSDMLEKNQKGALVFIDFDDFKAVNDTYGHRVGDELLSEFGKKLSVYLSLKGQNQETTSFETPLPKIIPARLAGDEFILLIQDIKNQQEVESIVENLFIKLFCEYKLFNEIEIHLTGSAGVALFPKHGLQYDELMKLADIAMYKAKTSGKNKIHFSN